MSDKLFENEFFYVLRENATIPWVKIFTQTPYKELTDCDEATRNALLQAMLITEECMKSYYTPDKVNIAMFGNYVPHVHIHVMARFQNDTHFPESMWGVKQRESSLDLPDFEPFVTILHDKLAKL